MLRALYCRPQSELEVCEPCVGCLACNVNVAVTMQQSVVGMVACPFRLTSKPLAEEVFLLGPFSVEVGDEHGTQVSIGLNPVVQRLHESLNCGSTTNSVEQTGCWCQGMALGPKSAAMADMLLHP
jgi:hypothetical protein